MSSLSPSPHRSADTLWKTLHHSAPEAFDFHFKGETEVCWFVITDNRLITVTAAGHRRTVELGRTPPSRPPPRRSDVRPTDIGPSESGQGMSGQVT
jgi:hypothetical protein